MEGTAGNAADENGVGKFGGDGHARETLSHRTGLAPESPRKPGTGSIEMSPGATGPGEIVALGAPATRARKCWHLEHRPPEPGGAGTWNTRPPSRGSAGTWNTGREPGRCWHLEHRPPELGSAGTWNIGSPEPGSVGIRSTGSSGSSSFRPDKLRSWGEH